MKRSLVEPARREYDRLASQYDRRWSRYIDATLDAALDAAALAPGERLLDVPCGTGELERRLTAELKVIGADLSGAMLAQARAKGLPASVAWVQADAALLPLADARFDAIVCASGFHYFPSPQATLLEFRRVLRPGGRLVLVDWCHDYVACKLCSLWLRATGRAFVRTYSLARCRGLLEGAGFRVTSSDRFRVGWLWGLMKLVAVRPHNADFESARPASPS